MSTVTVDTDFSVRIANDGSKRSFWVECSDPVIRVASDGSWEKGTICGVFPGDQIVEIVWFHGRCADNPISDWDWANGDRCHLAERTDVPFADLVYARHLYTWIAP